MQNHRFPARLQSTTVFSSVQAFYGSISEIYLKV